MTAAILSNLVSNVPAVMLFTPLVPRLPDPERAPPSIDPAAGSESGRIGNLNPQSKIRKK